MFQIKICGITNVEDARAVARAGADAVGLNFYAKSPRAITTDQARAIIRVLPSDMVKVGLFVDTPPAEIGETFDRLGLDLIQLHGDQPPEFLTLLGGRPVMPAFRIGPAGLDPVVAYLHACKGMSHKPAMLLFDSYKVDCYGGTGIGLDISALSDYRQQTGSYKIILAGGLTPFNVANAIQTTYPDGIDTSSGVESSPGHKDAAAVAAFVNAAREAFRRIKI
jgi:phosphoribosylanthranilate isomerase